MKIYIITILLTSIFAAFSEISFKRNKSNLGKVMLGISLLIPCIIAGVRSILTGRDITVYVTKTFILAERTTDILQFLKETDIEYGFSLLVYLSSKLGDIHWTLFFTELFVVIPIYTYIYKTRKEKSVTIMVIIFMLTMYCISLNIMRQSIAIAFIILAYYFWSEKKIKIAVVLWGVAILFHTTAIIAIFIPIVSTIIKKDTKYKVLYLFGLILIMIFIAVFLDKFLIMSSHFSLYITRKVDLTITDVVVSIVKKCFWIILIIISLTTYKTGNSSYKKRLSISLILLIFDVILFLCSLKISGVGRIGYYFLNLSYFEIIHIIYKSFKPKNIIKVVIIIILCMFWMKMTTGDIESCVYPYKSDIIDCINIEEE